MWFPNAKALLPSLGFPLGKNVRIHMHPVLTVQGKNTSQETLSHILDI